MPQPFTQLVNVAELASLATPAWRIFDCRFNLADLTAGRQAYAEGHLPGAFFLDLEDDLSGPRSGLNGRHPLPDPQLLADKLGSVGVALTGAAFYLAAISFVLLQLGAFGYFPLGLVPWFLVYVVLAILMVGAISAALGSTCNDAKDAQNLALPALLPVMLPMFILGPVLKEPHSSFAFWASFVPPFTPMLMLLRQSTPGGVPFWQPWVGLAGMLVFAWIAVFAAARVFRIGLLMQGKAPGLGKILRWAIKG